jgi:hypothetical protein
VRRIVHAQAGLTWGELDAETQAHGLAVTGGRMSTTGVAGFTLGSGSGYLERKLGLAADNLLKMGYTNVLSMDGGTTAFWDGAIIGLDRERFAHEQSRAGQTTGIDEYEFYAQQRTLNEKQQQAQFERQQAMLAKEIKFIERFKARASHAAQVQSRVKKLEKIERVQKNPWVIVGTKPGGASLGTYRFDHLSLNPAVGP